MRDALHIGGDTGVDVLIVEIERYLSAVETFRSLGCEPIWRLETPSDVVVRVRAWLEPYEQSVSRP